MGTFCYWVGGLVTRITTYLSVTILETRRSTTGLLPRSSVSAVNYSLLCWLEEEI